MRNQHKLLIAFFAIVLGIITVLWPRSLQTMETFAKQELKNHINDSIIDELKGPLYKKTRGYTDFIWYKELEWGDTSKVTIRICRNIFSCNKNKSWLTRINQYDSPSVLFNNKWSYFLYPNGTESYKNIAEDVERIHATSLYTDEISMKLQADSSVYIVPEEFLILFLEKGYFNILKKDGDQEFAVIIFYEPIAIVYRDGIEHDVLTVAAFLHDDSEMKIVPYNVNDAESH